MSLGFQKVIPLYYVEILNDTNSGDGVDTEGLIVDIVSNSASSVVVAADADALGLEGDEQIAIRKHLTIGDVFDGAVGLPPFGSPVTIFNEDGPGTAISHVSNGSGGFVLTSDFTTISTDAPVYPGTDL